MQGTFLILTFNSLLIKINDFRILILMTENYVDSKLCLLRKTIRPIKFCWNKWRRKWVLVRLSKIWPKRKFRCQNLRLSNRNLKHCNRIQLSKIKFWYPITTPHHPAFSKVPRQLNSGRANLNLVLPRNLFRSNATTFINSVWEATVEVYWEVWKLQSGNFHKRQNKALQPTFLKLWNWLGKKFFLKI